MSGAASKEMFLHLLDVLHDITPEDIAALPPRLRRRVQVATRCLLDDLDNGG